MRRDFKKIVGPTHTIRMSTWLNVAHLCIEVYDHVHAADDSSNVVSNVDVRGGRKFGCGDRIEIKRQCPEV